jgi:hypothetical protein
MSDDILKAKLTRYLQDLQELKESYAGRNADYVLFELTDMVIKDLQGILEYPCAYLLTMDFNPGVEFVGIFSTSEKAWDHVGREYVGKKYNLNKRYTRDMFNVERKMIDNA